MPIQSGSATLFLKVVAGLDGDFDGGGGIDGADFLTWQRDISIGDLADWQANYGLPAGSLAASSAAVPEPGTLLLIAMASVCGLVLLRQR